jgi:hypothetical protein
MKLPVAFLLLFVSTSARAEVCIDFKSCTKLMYDLKGQRYIWDAKFDEHKFSASPDVEMTKDNAELVYTSLLDFAGFARLPVGDGKTYRIERSVNLKEIEAPVFDASADKPPVLPNTWDWVTMRYKLKTPDEAGVLESMYRLHLPREARMQADDNSGNLIITGAVPVVRQMYETIRAADRPIGKVARAHYEEFRGAMLHPRPFVPPVAAAQPPPPPAPKSPKGQ